MIKKIYKLFGIKVFEIEQYPEGETPKKLFEKKPQGAVLDYSPEDEKRDKENEIVKKMI